jgi:hypothetical protein
LLDHANSRWTGFHPRADGYRCLVLILMIILILAIVAAGGYASTVNLATVLRNLSREF